MKAGDGKGGRNEEQCFLLIFYRWARFTAVDAMFIQGVQRQHRWSLSEVEGDNGWTQMKSTVLTINVQVNIFEIAIILA